MQMRVILPRLELFVACLIDPIPVKKGDILTMQSVYNLKKHATRPDAHGKGEAHGSMAGKDVMGMWALTFKTDPSKI
jgi:hypothetical protein